MKLVRLAVLGLLVALSTAITTASASALEWLVEGKPLAAEETVTGASLGTTTLLTTINGLHLEITCADSTWSGTLIPKTTAKFSTWLFLECKVSEPSGCKLEESITYDELPASLQAPSLISFSLPSTAFVEITECSLEGEYQLKGKFACEVEKPAEAAVEKNCAFKAGTDQEWKFGTHEADLEGTVTYKLAGVNKGKKWGIE